MGTFKLHQIVQETYMWLWGVGEGFFFKKKKQLFYMVHKHSLNMSGTMREMIEISVSILQSKKLIWEK